MRNIEYRKLLIHSCVLVLRSIYFEPKKIFFSYRFLVTGEINDSENLPRLIVQNGFQSMRKNRSSLKYSKP